MRISDWSSDVCSSDLLVDDGKVYLGGDSAGVAGWSLTVRTDPQVFRVGDCIIGFTSSFRMGQLLAHSFQPPQWHADYDVYDSLVRDFVEAVQTGRASCRDRACHSA